MPGESIEMIDIDGVLVELAAALRSFGHGPPPAGEPARIGALLRGLARALEASGHDGASLLAGDMGLAAEAAQGRDGVVPAALERCLRVLETLTHRDPAAGEEGLLEAARPLTLVNELRAVRGAPLLTGNAFVTLDPDMDLDTHDSEQTADPDTHDSTDLDTHHSAGAPATADTLAAGARRLRAVYQRGLLAWLRGTDEDDGAARILEACDGMASLCATRSQIRLWRAAGVFAEVLRDRRWRRSAAVKRLLGQLDGRLKRAADGGEAALDAPPALVRSLLYYVAVAPDAGPRAAAVRERHDLAAAFGLSRRRGEAPDAVAALTLLNELLTLAGALLEPPPAGGAGAQRDGMLAGSFLHVADALALLGLPELRCRIVDELARFESTRLAGHPPAGGWGQMAERLHACGVALLEAAGVEPAAAFAGHTVPRERGALLATRLEADLTHAEEIIRRLESAAPAPETRGREQSAREPGSEPSPPGAEPEPGATPVDAPDAMTEAARELSERLARLSAPTPAVSAEAPVADPDPELVDDLLLIAAEVGAARMRLEQQAGAWRDGLRDMGRVLRALRDELARLRTQAGAQLGDDAEGDPLRLRMEGLADGIGRLSELRGAFEEIAAEHRAVLGRQARDSHALNERLMRTRMRPLGGQLDALRRRVEESAARTGRQLTLHAESGDVLVEPEKLAALMPALGGLLEEIVRHGVERPHERVLVGKSPGCAVSLRFSRRGADLDVDLRADCPPPPPEALAHIRSGLAPLGARLDLQADDPAKTHCMLRLPLAPRLATVLLVETGGETLALPLGEVEAVVQAEADSLAGGEHEHGGERYAFADLGEVLGFSGGAEDATHGEARVPLVLVEAGGERRALAVDRIGDRVDVVVQSVGPQLRALSGLAGASILGDGTVVLLLDVGWLVRASKACEASA